MTKEQKKTKRISREEILKRLAIAEAKAVFVEALGGEIMVRVPSFGRIAQLRLECQDDLSLNVALAVESCVDLKPEDRSALINGNPGIAAAIVNAVMSLKSAITDDDVGKP